MKTSKCIKQKNLFLVNAQRNAKILLICLLYLCLSLNIYAQKTANFKLQKSIYNAVKVDQLFAKNNEIYSLEKIGEISGLAISGNIKFNNESGFVRVVLVDDNYDEYLVYEAYSWINSIKSLEIDNICEETSLLNNVKPKYIKVELSDATIIVNKISLSASEMFKSTTINDKKEQLRKFQISEKINEINKSLVKQNKKWFAGETSISGLTYAEKKNLFGGNLPNLYGFEYYKGGIFELPYEDPKNTLKSSLKSTSDVVSNSPYVADFDWRNKHGQNWLSPVKNQLGCGSCWAFAGIAATELMVNLYYNDLLNLDLSEQEALSCGPGSCGGGWSYDVLAFVRDSGIVNEACFPYEASNAPCSLKCANPGELIHIEDFDLFDVTDGNMKSGIISGTVAAHINSWSHVLNFAGYKTIQAGDFLEYKSRETDTFIEFQEGDPLIGKTAWLIKNSWGTGFGDQGYAYIVTDINNISSACKITGKITSMNHTDNDIICEDLDGDGYYNWGIGPKPAHCPSCPDERDGNDSAPQIGPMDQYGHCIQILQAEYAVINKGIAEDEHTGYTGTGYVNYDNETGSSVTFNLTTEGEGKYNCVLRYANGSTTAREMDVIVNGTEDINELMFDITGSYTSWQDKEFDLYLQNGNNTVEFVATGSSGGPNIDKLSFGINDFVIVANTDHYVVDWNQPNVLNILKNDYDPEGNSISIVSVNQPVNGTIVNNGDSTITYTPNFNFTGMDSLTYAITDGIYTVQSHVSIEVYDIEDKPVVRSNKGNIFRAPISTVVYNYDGWFYDHDNDKLKYSITSSNESAVYATGLNENSMSLYIVDTGIAKISVTASDSFASVTDNFFVISTFNSTDPVVVDPIPDQSFNVGESLIIENLDDIFNDPNGDELSYSGSSSNSSSAYCFIMEKLLAITTAQEDTVTITLTATDDDGNSASFSFTLYLTAATSVGDYNNLTNINKAIKKNAAISMAQNYPNPFSDATNIGFYLSQDTHVNISLIDMLGRQIATIANDNFMSGYNEVLFKRGTLKPGIYFYTINGNKQSIVSKMIIK